MQKSIRVQAPLKEQKSTILLEDPKDPRVSKKGDATKPNQASKSSPPKAKPPEKKDCEPPHNDTNFSQESQNMEFLERRVDVIIEEAVSIENEYGKSENEEELNFEERMQAVTTKLQQIFDAFGSRQEELETWLRESLSTQIQTGLEKVGVCFQTLENTIRERKELQEQTSQGLSLAVSVQKYLKENQRVWSMN